MNKTIYLILLLLLASPIIRADDDHDDDDDDGNGAKIEGFTITGKMATSTKFEWTIQVRQFSLNAPGLNRKICLNGLRYFHDQHRHDVR